MSADQVGCNCRTKYVMDKDCPRFSCMTKHEKGDYCIVESFRGDIERLKESDLQVRELKAQLLFRRIRGTEENPCWCSSHDPEETGTGHMVSCDKLRKHITAKR